MSAQLAGNNFRPMDPTSGQGLSDQMDQKTLPDYANHYLRQVSGSLSINGGRGPGTFRETGNSSSPSMRGPVHKSLVPSTEERWVTVSGDQFETTEWVRTETAFQNGRIQHGEGPTSTRRLDVLIGSQGCILFSSHCQGTSQVSQVHMERPDLRVHLPSLRTLQCSLNFHEVVVAGNGPPTNTRCEADCVSRRHTCDAPVEGVTRTADKHDNPATTVTRIHSESTEVQLDTNSADPIPGVCNRFNTDEALPARREGSRDQSHVSEPLTGMQSNHSTTITVTGKNDSSNTSCSFSPTPVPSTPATQDQVIQKVRVIRQTGDLRSRNNTGLAVVDEPTQDGEWERHQSTSPGYGYRDRCLIDGLGCSLQRCEDRRPVVNPGTTSPHKCTRAKSRYVRSPGVCEEQTECPCPSEDGQHFSPGIRQPDGRNSICHLDRSSL